MSGLSCPLGSELDSLLAHLNPIKGDLPTTGLSQRSNLGLRQCGVMRAFLDSTWVVKKKKRETILSCSLCLIMDAIDIH